MAKKKASSVEKDRSDDSVSEILYENINEGDANILKSQNVIDKKSVSYFGLFKYAQPLEFFGLAIACLCAIVEGVAMPMYTIVVGAITNNFSDFVTGDSMTQDFSKTVNHNALYFVYIGIAILGSSFVEAFLFVSIGQRISSRYRKKYLKATMRQNIAYFDKLGPGTVATRITNDTTSIQEAISEKLGAMIKSAATFIAALIIALATGWKLALILLSAVAYFIIGVSVASTFFLKYNTQADRVYTEGSNIAEESFSAARNTIAFGAQKKLTAKFDSFLLGSKAFMHKGNIAVSVMLAILWSTIAWMYALAFWEGSRLVKSGEISLGHIITIFIALLLGAFEMSALAPLFKYFINGVSAGSNISETIARIPVIDSANPEGTTLAEVRGRIEFSHVNFRYPSRPDALVLPDFSLTVEPGQTVALVGTSGSGKSTCIGLLERFYLPLSGKVTLDDVDLADLNVKWLRQQMGLVSQEPTLFADSIADNIAYGLIGTEYENADPEKKRELVIEACKQANAWDFIQSLNEGLETNVGERGFLLSGGQKQRIAIARAVVGNPRILLLDEATSALDTKSEGIVQEALDRAAKSRTTIVIAHRLSTIKNADKIVLMQHGEIIEQGTHQELLEKKGAYFDLVELQTVAQRAHGGYEEKKEEGLVIQEDKFIKEDDDFDSSLIAPIPGLKVTDVSIRKIIALLWRLNKHQQKAIMLSFVFATTTGYAQCAYAILTGKSSSAMMVTPSGYDQMRKTINLTSGMFFMIGVHQFILGYFFIIVLSLASENLLRNVRLELFKQILRMDISFFDHEKNTAGSLTAILAKDGKAIEGLGGSTMGQITQCIVMVIGGIVTGIAFNWRLGLVGTACIPVIVMCGYGRLKVLINFEQRNRKVYESSAGLASSYASSVRTVQTLTREDDVCKHYDAVIDQQVRDSYRPAFISAAVFGFSSGAITWIVALIFWYGSKLLSEGKIKIMAYYVVFMGLILGANAAGQIFNYVPDMGKARTAAENVLRMLEAKPNIDPNSDDGLVISRAEGRIEFKDVFFRYPTRPQVPVLRGVSLKVEPGQYVAFVGASGCGKSTTIGLIERFYDPYKGSVTLDGHELRDININNLRSNMALVQQEPLLYSGTIKENILIGWDGDDSDVTDAMLESVCRQANIHDFIISLPDGYNTDVGSHGSLLSGGQKQRIAIARALIRNPPILLLDEATSALDAESEKVVQAALDAAINGRTVISIAHKLSTIQNADMIYVFNAGVVVEQGTHQQLLALEGRYAELVRLQNLEGT